MTRRAENAILQINNERRCLECKEIKHLSDFTIERRNISGRGARCLICERLRLKNLMYRSDIRKKCLDREKLKLKNNPCFAITKRVRRAIRHLLNSSKVRGSTRYLDYSAKDLKLHLELKFLPGMSWSNMSEWHIDHIKPIAAFDATALADPNSKEFKEAWALENLQPLWQSDNCSKGARY